MDNIQLYADYLTNNKNMLNNLNNVLDDLETIKVVKKSYRTNVYFFVRRIKDTLKWVIVPNDDVSNIYKSTVYELRSDGTINGMPFAIVVKVFECILAQDFDNVPVLKETLNKMTLEILNHFNAEVISKDVFDERYSALRKVK